MRIAISGREREDAVRKVEGVLHCTAVKPKFIEDMHPIIDYAAITYADIKGNDVIFDGSVLDVFRSYSGEGYNDVIEQIAINSLATLDKVVVIKKELSLEELKVYNEFASMFPDKFIFAYSASDLEISLN